ncbi:MAG: molybdopterin molybdotransferase MoeA [Methylomicrobium sp.]|nr:molybdopterin molybdotransferase MoeA [Methylomicrobium sp.]
MIDACIQTEDSLLTLEETLTRIESSIEPIIDAEKVNLHDALGRVLAESVMSPIDLPYHNNASMDGYTLASSDINPDHPFSLNLIGTSWAGQPYDGSILPGQCVRIFTGGVVPEALDTVVMQEHVQRIGEIVHFPAKVQALQHVRIAGEDIAKNALLITAPKRLSAIDLGLLASAGIYQVNVKHKIKIAFLSTGDELTPIGQALAPGNIYDSNRYMLSALLKEEAFSTTDLGAVPDDKDRLESLLTAAAETHDAIITTGGASVGEADFIQEILDKIGQVELWKIAVKPGKPLAFGSIGNCRLFGLPGNPVSVVLAFQRIVIPGLRFMAGLSPEKPLQLTVICQESIKKSPGRLEFIRGILSQSDNGEHQVRSAGKQGSHILSSMSLANCFIVLPGDCKGIKKGDRVVVEPLSTWID